MFQPFQISFLYKIATHSNFLVFMGILNSQSLDLVAHGSDLASQLASIVAGDAGSDDSTADTTGSAKVHLAANVDVGD